MRLRSIAIVFSGFSLMLFAASVQAQKFGKGLGKKPEGERVNINSVPPPVIQTARREQPNATYTSVQRSSQKNGGSVYTFDGTEGRYHVRVTISASGELQYLTKGLESGKEKNK